MLMEVRFRSPFHTRTPRSACSHRRNTDQIAGGTIDKEEFLLVCEDARELLHEGEMARAFASIDMDGNGVLDRTELQHALERAVVQRMLANALCMQMISLP